MDGPGGIGMGGFFAGPSGEWGGVWMVKQCLKSDKVSKGLNRLQNIYIYIYMCAFRVLPCKMRSKWTMFADLLLGVSISRKLGESTKGSESRRAFTHSPCQPWLA